MEAFSEFKESDVHGMDKYHDYHLLSRHRHSILGTISGYGRRWFVKSLIPEIADSTSSLRSLNKEFEILLSLSHPGIVRAIELIDIPEAGPSIIMEYIEGYTLDKAPEMTRTQRESLALQLIDALGYLHSKGVTHGDLKPENIMVKGLGAGHPSLKIIDFNLADSDEYNFDKEAGGNRKYAAPEQFSPGYRLRPSADVYSLGLLLKELNLGPTWTPTIGRCLKASPEKRLPDAAAVKRHYFKDKKNIRILGILAFLICVAACCLIFVPGEKTEIVESQISQILPAMAAPSAPPASDSITKEIPPAETTSESPSEQLASIPKIENEALPETKTAAVESSVPVETHSPSKFEYLDSIRKEKELQIQQIFSRHQQEIQATLADSTLSNTKKTAKINSLYSSAFNKALFRFGEFLDQCPPESVKNPPAPWKRFISQSDFEDFNNFVVEIKKSL